MNAQADLLQTLCGRIYAFGTVALGLKFLDVKGIQIADIAISIDQKQDLVAAVGVATLMMAVTAAICLWRDSVAASMVPTPSGPAPSIQAVQAPLASSEKTNAEKYAAHYLVSSTILLFISSVFPIIYGMLAFIACLPEVGHAVATRLG